MVLGKFIHFLGAQQSTFSVRTFGPNCPGHFGTKRSIFALFYGEHPSEALYGMVCSSKWATNYAAARFSLSPTVFPFSLSPMPQSVTALAATQDHYQYRCNWKQLTQPNFTFSLEHIEIWNMLMKMATFSLTCQLEADSANPLFAGHGIGSTVPSQHFLTFFTFKN